MDYEMTTIHDEEAVPDCASDSVQFQTLTLFVWIGAVALLIAGVKRAQGGHLSPPRLVMPALHLVPWCIALVERRRIRRILSPQRDQCLIKKVITRVLWTGYLTLTLVEYWLY
jgi:hypothetical protein